MTAVEVCPICDIAGCRHIRERKAKMTNPTDEELDAAVAGLQSMIADPWDKRTWEGAAPKLGNGVAAINALRAQLAEADAMIEAQAKDHAENNIRLSEMSHRVSQLEGMVMSGQGEQIRLAADLLRAKIECNEANARADRAEGLYAMALGRANDQEDRADLAAQIEADAGLIDSITAEASKGILLGSAEDRAVLDMMKSLSAAIRAQPHDRTALDRMLAEARVQALREAADKVDAIIRAAEEANLNERKEGLRDAHNAITRMIEGGK